MTDHGWLDKETVVDLRAELDALPQWRLGVERWVEVELILDRLASALTRADREAVREAANLLALTGPVRVTRIGAGHLPPPDEVMERRAVLEHVLVEPDPVATPDDDR
ncbi:CATRA system-associated protein [Actinokineospora sp. NBRC 105648]|uniref:CATRA system-associated protein n=1 Tax=Actinokineospora sp. NBRC 105648 TaxID=3032206 RepID=UPI0024A2451B|nr:CATRA system-associated protein [Actinokineospora sp. NBRC 105648]GLZ37133.1 hypothetical protein Acsp05_07580 [Actinokineospora sp. NBRC 105648]